MRSIRRSLLGYFLVLLAGALGLIAGFVDRYAVEAIQAREHAESQRTAEAFKARRLEAQAKFDAELLQEARSLSGELLRAWARNIAQRGGRPPEGRPPAGPGAPRVPDPPRVPFPGKAPDDDAREYLTRLQGLLRGSAAAGGLHSAATVAAVARSTGWIAFESPRTVARVQIPETIRRLFEDVEHPGIYQFQAVVLYPTRPPHQVGIVRAARLGTDVPFDPAAFDEPGVEASTPAVVELPGQGTFRHVVVGSANTPQGSRPLVFPVWLEPQTLPPAAQSKASPTTVLPAPPGPGPQTRAYRTPPDFWVRVFVHALRSQDELDARLAQDAAASAEELQRVQRETRAELVQLRTRFAAIAAGSFLALVVGGWLIVARGLAPVRTLSEAVSRVSEKDFSLPVVAGDLSVELAPIHARLTQTLDQLRAAFAREKEAVADISHELRTPIASLLATIDVTLRKPRTPEQYRTTLEDCRGIAKQLGQLVERIMTLASLDAGTARGAVLRVDAAELAGSCAVVIRPLAEAHGLSFTLSAVGPAELDTDADRLREVLMNLLHNAVEYNRPNGRVELSVKPEEGRVVFEVRDTGIGMTDAVREKIFERFYRADASRTATGIHAGLGLAIVKEYVERLGGAIEVESTPGEGSRFRASFPAAPAQPESPTPPPDIVLPEPRPRTRPAPAAS
jgi:signal transduction histidine kinase